MKGRKKRDRIWLCLINKVPLDNLCQWDFCISDLKLKIHLHASLLVRLALWLARGLTPDWPVDLPHEKNAPSSAVKPMNALTLKSQKQVCNFKL